METTQLKMLFNTLDDIRHQNGVEYWFAGELCKFLGYSDLSKFIPVIDKAKQACKNSGGMIDDHFIDLNGDIKLTRYACYLVAVNGNPKKQEVAFAQAYFVTQTRQLEAMQQRMEDFERIDAREKLKITEKEFGSVAFARGVDGKGMALIRSRGDQELFGKDRTTNIKEFLNISNDKPVADVLPTVTLKAKDLATAMTIENARQKNLYGTTNIGKEHVENNKSVREALTKSGIYPENMPPAEDIKKIEIKHRKELKELKEKQRKELEKVTKSLGKKNK